MTTVVSIGRNIGTGGERLSPGRWNTFRHEVRYAVDLYAGPIVFAGEGIGEWEREDDEGNTVRETEQAATIIGAGARTERRGLPGLVGHLAILAAEYEQEAIAVTVGEVQFVGPDLDYGV